MVSAASSLSLRLAENRDAEWIANLRNELASSFLSQEPATPAATIRMLETSKTYIVEQTDEGPIASFALYNADGVTVEFGRFMMVKGLHGQGLGRAVLNMAMKEARRLGFKNLRLIVRADNLIARCLYLDAGFQIVQLNGAIEMYKELV